MFLGKVVAFLRNISFFSLFKSSFIDVEPPFKDIECRFKDTERRFTSTNGDFFSLYQQKNLGIKAIPIDWKCFILSI